MTRLHAALRSPWAPLLLLTAAGWVYAIAFLIANGGPTVAGDEWNYGIVAYEVCDGAWPLYYNRTDVKLGALEGYTAAPFVCLLSNKAWALKIAALVVHSVGGIAFARCARAISGHALSASLAMASWWFGPMLLVSWAWRVNSYGMLLTGGCVLIALAYVATQRERATHGWLGVWLGYGVLAGLLTWSHPATLLFLVPLALWLAWDLRAKLAWRAVAAGGFVIGLLPSIVFNFSSQPTVAYVSSAVAARSPTAVLGEMVTRGVVRLAGAILPWESAHWIGGIGSLLQVITVVTICGGLAATCVVAIANLRKSQWPKRSLAPVLLGLLLLQIGAYIFSSWGISGKARYVLTIEVVALAGLPIAAGFARRISVRLSFAVAATVVLQLIATTALAWYHVDDHLLDGAHRPTVPGPRRADRIAAALRAQGVTTVYGNHYSMGPIAFAGQFLWNDQFHRPRDWGRAAREQPIDAKAIICDGRAYTEAHWTRWLTATGITFTRMEVDDVVALYRLQRSPAVIPLSAIGDAPPAAIDLDPYSVWRARPSAIAALVVTFTQPVDLDRVVLWMSQITVHDRGIEPSTLIYAAELEDGTTRTGELRVTDRLHDGILDIRLGATGVRRLALRSDPAMRWGVLELGLFGRPSRAAIDER